MIYLQPRRKQGIRLSMPMRIGTIFVVVFLALAFIFPYAFQGTFQTVAYPLWQFGAHISNFFGGASGTFMSKTELLEENNRLRQQMRSSEHLVASLQILDRENKELKTLLGHVRNPERVLAPILSRPPRMTYDTLILGVGLGDSIESGDRVYVFDDIAIGEITAVYLQTSLVTLYSTPGREIDVRVGTSTLTAVGRGLGSYVIETPRELNVATGTPVTLPGMVPSLIGIVVEKEAHPADPVETLYVQNPYTLSTVDFAIVVPKHVEQEEVDESNASDMP